MPAASDSDSGRSAHGHDTAAVGAARLHVLGCDRGSLCAWFAANGRLGFRADQVLEWVYRKGADAFGAMTNLSKADRAWLAENAGIYTSNLTRESLAADGTRKLLLTWPDGSTAETVWIPEPPRHTVCVSSQVGCPVGCRFCASGVDGLERDLTAGEIVEQALRVARLVEASGAPSGPDGAGARRMPRLSNVVLMGMGEPLANFEQVMAAIRIMNADWGLGIGARKITLSTVGLPKQIRRLADEQLQLNLALSLHAPDDRLRAQLIPWGKVPIDELLAACSYYFRKTGREVTLEYVLLAGVNDHAEHAEKLAAVCRRLRCNVNLLRYNPVAGLHYARPTAEAAYEFQRRLRAQGVNAHVRTSRGKDIDAACGQLRRAAMTVAGQVPTGSAPSLERESTSSR